MDQKLTFGGPEKFDLATALFSQHSNITFTIDGKPVECMVTGVQREDGSGRSFNITGVIVRSKARFTAWYRTDRKKGTLTID